MLNEVLEYTRRRKLVEDLRGLIMPELLWNESLLCTPEVGAALDALKAAINTAKEAARGR